MFRKEIKYINIGKDKEERILRLKEVISKEEKAPQVLTQYSNNHIHTTYSFSPYTPAAAVWAARDAGLNIAGIMDHDSISGADEFRKAADVAGIGATCGLEIRVNMKDTPFADRRINHPDQNGAAYMAIHSVRSEYFDDVKKKMAPLVEIRNERNVEMVHKISRITGIDMDFEKEVMPLSFYKDGGSVTERHVLFAFAKKMLEKEWGASGADMSEEEKITAQYKKLGELKADMKSFYIPADKEMMTLDEAIDFAGSVGGLLCYAYLGDVTVSVTGDKKTATYEDAYLDELLKYLKDRGIGYVTFMPSRNTSEQLDRVMALCRQLSLRQISGEDINSPGQSFICRQLSEPRFSHLVKMAHELVEREK